MILRNYQSLTALCSGVFYVLSASILLFFTTISTAQTSKIATDSITIQQNERFIASSDNIEEIQDLITNTFEEKKDTVLGLHYAKMFLERGKAANDLDIQQFASSQLTFINYLKSDYNEVIRYGSTSVKIANKTRDTISIISGNTLLGSALYVIGNYDEALEFYLSAKELSFAKDYTQYKVICLTNIANIRLKLRRAEDALRDFDDVLTILNRENSDSYPQYNETYLSAVLGKGLCLSELNKLNEAEDTYATGIKFSDSIGNKKYEGFFNINLGDVYLKKEKYHQSLGFLKQGKEMLREFQDLQNNKFIADYFIAKNYFSQEKYSEALAVLDDVLERVGDNINTDKTEEMYQLASQIAQIQEDDEKSMFYLARLNKIIKSKEARKSLAKDILHEADIKEQVIKNERLENEKTRILFDKRITLVISGILLVLVLLVFYVYHQKTKLKEQKFLAIIDEISKDKTIEKTEKIAQVSKIKDEKAKAILEKLEALEETEFFLSQDATLHATAKLLDTNTTYLSKALNAVKKQTFSQYLNKLRIDYVLVKLKVDAVFRSYTIHAISKEIGYKSATTFIKEFKNKTGLNPSYYIKKIKD